MKKLCKKCGRLKDVDLFYKQRATCKKCYLKERAEYANTILGRLAGRRAAKAYRLRFPGKTKARAAVRRAVRLGIIVEKPCEADGCGKKKVESHHTDYRKLLDVIWLCKKHHKEADK